MKLEIAKAIVTVADDNGLDVTLHDDYSGRGMYGKQCAAVVGEQDDIMKCIIQVAYDAGTKRDNDVLDELMVEVRWDSMGRSGSIAY